MEILTLISIASMLIWKTPMQVIDLDEHVGFKAYSKIEKVCKILFQQTPVSYFCFQRFYADGSFTFLPTQTDLAHYFLSDDVYSDSWLLSIPFECLKSGLFLWDVAVNFSSPKQKEITEVIRTQIGLKHGIDIVEKFSDFCDIYCFASSDPKLYHCLTSDLKKFLFYFRQECHKLIQQAKKERLYLPLNRENGVIIPILEDPILATDRDHLYHVKKYYLQGSYEDVYLTEKEVTCLRQFSKGFTAKEIARLLNISHRTIEHHIEHIKYKLNSANLAEVMMIASKQNII